MKKSKRKSLNIFRQMNIKTQLFKFNGRLKRQYKIVYSNRKAYFKKQEKS